MCIIPLVNSLQLFQESGNAFKLNTGFGCFTFCASGSGVLYKFTITYRRKMAIRGFGNLGRMAIYFQGAGEHW